MPIGDPLVDTLLSRDLDSRPNEREQRAVTEWLQSNKIFHLMLDHPHHKTTAKNVNRDSKCTVFYIESF